VRLLDHARGTNDEADTIDRRVQHVLTHSRYNDNTFNNDIALLRLDREVVFRDRLRPVCLPPLGMLSVLIDNHFRIDITYLLPMSNNFIELNIKVDLSVRLINYHTLKKYSILNCAQRHEDVW
jgi:hypothetical protein